jgi:8-oxo-dGTP pyrophosphatase MutT (NUDIX family)
MAQSSFTTHQYPSSHFVESCGAVLFDLSNPEAKKICLVQYQGMWIIAKGRRNIGETRQSAALREVMEETGYRCHIVPVRMPTRAPLPDDPVNLADEARIHEGLTEPFMFTMRELKDGASVKLIWWYIAALDHGAYEDRLPGEEDIIPEFFSVKDAVEKLTYQTDRDVLKRAIELIEGSP